ncbi:hypothetical protein Sjap_016212 [Stephania japonica]|uniref:Protein DETOXIFICATION n=1 Tax=Stephania japonica TaxID=461633 RepID=A0AAP0NTK7_9MAGN
MVAEIRSLQNTLLSYTDPIVEEDSKPRVSSSTLKSGTVSDIEPISSTRDFFKEFWAECKKIWFLAALAIFTSLSRYSLATVTQAIAGHLGNLELAAVSIAKSVITGFTLGIAHKIKRWRLCGQAYASLQRSCVIVKTTGLILSPLLRLIGQKPEIADAAGRFALWMLPQLFAYTMNFPVVKFLQAQRKMMITAAVAAVALGLHTLFSWLLMFKLKWRLVGAAVALNAPWRFIVAAMLVYIFNGACGRAWSGFSWMAFKNLWSFVKLSIASAVMLSIRVSNELGAGHPRAAKFAIFVVVINSFLIGLILALILITFRQEYPTVFTNSDIVRKLVNNLTPLLAFSIVISNVQPILAGAAVGAGWQALVAYGIWIGMISGTVAQTCILLILTYKTNWDKEASTAEDRIQERGGKFDDKGSSSLIAGTVSDLEPISSPGAFFREFWVECKKLWVLAAPAIFTTLSRYSIGAVTQAFAGHLGNIELAAVSIANTVIAGFTMVGDGERTGDTLWPGVWSGAVGHDGSVAEVMGDCKHDRIDLITFVHLCQAIVEVNWVETRDCRRSRDIRPLDVAAVVCLHNDLPSHEVLASTEKDDVHGCASLLVYIFSGACGQTWSGFSWMAFKNLWSFVKLSVASAIMLCLEICMNIFGWTLMVALGYNAATSSIRVSNELGAGHPRRAKFAIVVVVINSFLIALILALILITFRQEYPTAFTNSEVVRKLVTNLTPLLAFSIIINSVQPVLTGAAVGAGWQALVAYVNIGCYYIFGVPLGLLLGYVFNYGVQGIWIGMISGTVAQTCILIILTYSTNWDKEASVAEDRIRTWGGEPDAKETMNK